MIGRLAAGTALAALLALPSPAPAAPAPAPAAELPKVEKTAPLEGEKSEMGIRSGDLELVRVEVKHQPGAVALAKAEANPEEQWRPRITVDFANPGNVKLRARLAVTLVDGQGQGYLTCEDEAVVGPRTEKDYKLLCLKKPMLLIDWPKVSHVKLVASTEPAEPTLDQAFPLEKNLATVKQAVGPITVDKVVVVNVPTAADLEKAKSNPLDKSRPKVVLLLSNPTEEKVKVQMRLVLEDAQGTAYLTCDRTDKLSPRSKSDDLTICLGQAIKTLDWPEITRVRVTVAVK